MAYREAAVFVLIARISAICEKVSSPPLAFPVQIYLDQVDGSDQLATRVRPFGRSSTPDACILHSVLHQGSQVQQNHFRAGVSIRDSGVFRCGRNGTAQTGCLFSTFHRTDASKSTLVPPRDSFGIFWFKTFKHLLHCFWRNVIRKWLHSQVSRGPLRGTSRVNIGTIHDFGNGHIHLFRWEKSLSFRSSGQALIFS